MSRYNRHPKRRESFLDVRAGGRKYQETDQCASISENTVSMFVISGSRWRVAERPRDANSGRTTNNETERMTEQDMEDTKT